MVQVPSTGLCPPGAGVVMGKERKFFFFLILWLFKITGGTVSGYTFFQTCIY